MARVAFIGLGNMGGGMAANLAAKGHDVRAFDLSAEALDKAKAAGCLPVASAAEACDGAEAVVTMLPAGKHVEAVYTDSVFGAAPASAILMDCSTIDVATAKRVGEAALAKGLTMVDAPVSGGIAAANAGTLTFMVGGSAEGFDRAQPFLADMGKAVIHAGAIGRGAGGEDLQQHGARRGDDRDVRGVRARRQARARPAEILRHRQRVVGAELVADQLRAMARRRAGNPRRPRLSGRLRDRVDAQGSAAGDGGRGVGRCRHADGREGGGAVRRRSTMRGMAGSISRRSSARWARNERRVPPRERRGA